jgi:hypothetical protein
MPKVLVVDDTFDSGISGTLTQSDSPWSTPGGYISPSVNGSYSTIMAPVVGAADRRLALAEAIFTVDAIQDGDTFEVNPTTPVAMMGIHVIYKMDGAVPTFLVGWGANTTHSPPLLIAAGGVPSRFRIPAFIGGPASETYIAPGSACTIEIRYDADTPLSDSPKRAHILINGTPRATLRANTTGPTAYDAHVVESGSVTHTARYRASNSASRLSRIQAWRHTGGGWDQTIFLDTFDRANGAYSSAAADTIYPGIITGTSFTDGSTYRGARLSINANRLFMSGGTADEPQYLIINNAMTTGQTDRPANGAANFARELSFVWHSGDFVVGVTSNISAAAPIASYTTMDTNDYIRYPGTGNLIYMRHNEKAAPSAEVSFNIGTVASGSVFTIKQTPPADGNADGWTVSHNGLTSPPYVGGTANVSDSPWMDARWANIFLATGGGLVIDTLHAKEYTTALSIDTRPADPGLAAQVYTGYPTPASGGSY